MNPGTQNDRTPLHAALRTIRPLTLCLAVLSAGLGPAAAQQPKSSTPASKPATATNSQQTKAMQPSSAEQSAATATTIIGTGTANYIPLFANFRTIHDSLILQSSTGIAVRGSVTAISFAGDGSALTGVNASTLGGLSSSSFAQTGVSNTFSTDQTITGNLNVSGYINSALKLQGNLTDTNSQQGANVIGGFAGSADGSFPGNSIDPSVIGGTIAGGGGAYDPSLIPHLVIKRAVRTARPDRHSGYPFARGQVTNRQSTGENEPEGSESPAPAEAVQPNNGVIPGNNMIPMGGAWATIGGGVANLAGGPAATVSGGDSNNASGSESTVGGGTGNGASDKEATVAGGGDNTASGPGSMIGGGTSNNAGGAGSFIGGGDHNEPQVQARPLVAAPTTRLTITTTTQTTRPLAVAVQTISTVQMRR